jgi:uncharacterized membrane protein
LNEIVIPGSPAQQRNELRLLTHVLYGLHMLSWFSAGVFSVVAMVINAVKQADLPDDFYRSHFRWQARSFWFTLLWLVLSLPLWALFVFPGWAAWSLIGLWYLYRYIKGWWRFADGKAMPYPAN